MAVAIVDLLEIVEVHQDQGEAAAVTAAALDLALESVQQGAIIAEAGKRIADGELPNLFEKAGVIEQRAAQDQGIAAGTQRQSQSERHDKRDAPPQGRALLESAPKRGPAELQDEWQC